ncbi:HesB/IscA family protein [Paenibacillus aquistagni]|uniref:Iron-sulfur cluster assembly protein n=1 Tax=Paenibacillus aquistagni TaxID=1852522 RepID=A0A1X7LTP3_9BACL|nr:iron-sulfur cluster assembly accessory protein [Paenibacillus aquistagni]SMG56857.1 iron-sulfur cluster assembly protein [Paenibacillus aquistagni]
MITISDLAAQKIKEMLEQEENQNMFLRLGVRPGGCSGYSYGMGFDDEETSEDVHLESHGMKVVVDKESIPHLAGLEIDYKESGMSGGFTIENPNAIATCGCGSSFRTATAAGKAEKCDD